MRLCHESLLPSVVGFSTVAGVLKGVCVGVKVNRGAELCVWRVLRGALGQKTRAGISGTGAVPSGSACPD